MSVWAAIGKSLVVAGSAILVLELGRRTGLSLEKQAIEALLWALVVSLSQDGDL